MSYWTAPRYPNVQYFKDYSVNLYQLHTLRGLITGGYILADLQCEQHTRYIQADFQWEIAINGEEHGEQHGNRNVISRHIAI